MRSQTLLDRIASVLFVALRVPLRVALRSYFRTLVVRNAERVPPSGPLLVIANHPATLSEVFLLATQLGRRFHFLAASFIFRPWIRGVFVRLCGTLPIYRRQDNPELTYRNEETFRACHDLFDMDGAIVIFPEGESLTDRSLLPLKTGAARLSLGYDSKPGREGRITVLPVGVHFSDRTAFQSDVTLSVGPRIDLTPFRESENADPQVTVRELTATMQASLGALILNVPNNAIEAFVRDVEGLYLEDLREKRPGEEDLDLLRRVAECIDYYRTRDPERLYLGWRRVQAYRRKREALGLKDQALAERIPSEMTTRCVARLALGGAAGFAPALAGALVNGLPYFATGFAARVFVPDAIRISAGRMVAGAVLFPVSYGFAAAGLHAGAGWSWMAVGVILALCLPLGYFALAYVRWLRKERELLRVAFLASRHRRLVAKLRAERKTLIRTFDQAREEYLAAVGKTI